MFNCMFISCLFWSRKKLQINYYKTGLYHKSHNIHVKCYQRCYGNVKEIWDTKQKKVQTYHQKSKYFKWYVRVLIDVNLFTQEALAQDKVDFSPVYRCLHIYTVLGEKEVFESYYRRERTKQARLTITPQGSAVSNSNTWTLLRTSSLVWEMSIYKSWHTLLLKWYHWMDVVHWFLKP